MLILNLPSANLKIIKKEDKTFVFDMLRRKYVSLTPEEWVRQHFTVFLIFHLGYPKGLLSNEVQIKLNNTIKRCDTILYDTSSRPRMIIEYKAPDVEITGEVFSQISRYNMALKADYLVVSNGISHYCCRMDYGRGKYTFLPGIPCYKDL